MGCARLPGVRARGLFALTLAGLAAACNNAPLPDGARAGRDEAAGRRIFERKCISCHNTNGDGKTIVAGHFPYANLLDGTWRSDGSAAAIDKQIREGHDPMPKFEGKLTDEEIRQTVAYVLQLSGGSTAEGGGRPAGGTLR
jgi:mono/diheme cytochrome c family protein